MSVGWSNWKKLIAGGVREGEKSRKIKGTRFEWWYGLTAFQNLPMSILAGTTKKDVTQVPILALGKSILAHEIACKYGWEKAPGRGKTKVYNIKSHHCIKYMLLALHTEYQQVSNIKAHSRLGSLVTIQRRGSLINIRDGRMCRSPYRLKTFFPLRMTMDLIFRATWMFLNWQLLYLVLFIASTTCGFSERCPPLDVVLPNMSYRATQAIKSNINSVSHKSKYIRCGEMIVLWQLWIATPHGYKWSVSLFFTTSDQVLHLYKDSRSPLHNDANETIAI
jgi:hypothetical protein